MQTENPVLFSSPVLLPTVRVLVRVTQERGLGDPDRPGPGVTTQAPMSVVTARGQGTRQPT